MAIPVLLYTADEFFLNQCKLLLGEDIRTFTVYSFSSPDRARTYLENNPDKIQCVLADRAFFAQTIPGRTLGVVMGEETVMEADAFGLFSLNIYQRKQDLLEELKQILRIGQLISGGSRASGAAKVLSFFSTQGGSGVSSLAYLTAVAAAEEGKAVYLNLEQAPCTGAFYANDGRKAEEFLCAVKDREDPGKTLLTALKRNEHGVYVFPTPVSMMDQRNLAPEDVRYIVEGLLSVGEAAYIVVDLSSGLSEVNDYIMSASDRVIMVYGDDRVGRVKRRQMMEDPAYSSYPWAGRERIAGNRCRQNYTDGTYDVCFPQSGSLAGEKDMRAALQGNPDLMRGCKALLQD